MVTNTGLVRPRLLGSRAGGQVDSPISTVASGAATMKMIKSTSITSINGDVDLVLNFELVVA